MVEIQMSNFRLLIYGLLIVCSTAYALDRHISKDKELLDILANTYYTGCMGGIIAVIEEGFFKGGQNSVDSNKNFYKMKQNCIKQQSDYRKFLGNEKHAN